MVCARAAKDGKPVEQPLRPLVVDLDGSLLRTDTLQEEVVASLRRPSTLAQATLTLLAHGKASMKRMLATKSRTDAALLPVNDAVLQLVRERAAQGGEVVLATGADESIARQIAARFPEIQDVLASDGTTNLTSHRKAEALVSRFGRAGFDYVGNSRADQAVWDVAADAYLATTAAGTGVPRWARARAFAGVLGEAAPSGSRRWMKELRIHQSLKNLLLFLPLIASHQFTTPTLILAATAGFVAFSFMASAVYLLNDLLDLDSDRRHQSKRNRPLAAGWIPPVQALVLSAVLAVVAVVIAALLNPRFLVVLLVYAVMTTSYSFWLKRVTLVDVVLLALLYMVRIIAGAVVTGTPLSFWFTGFFLFLFLSLALVKRYSEAHQARAESRSIAGRGYSGDDVHAVLALGTSAGIAAVLLLATYIHSDAVILLYPAPIVLWLVIPVLFYWVGNLWIKAGRGQMHDDPVIFALRDRASILAAAVLLGIFVIASLPWTAVVLGKLAVFA